jgi:hypothetical protein
MYNQYSSEDQIERAAERMMYRLDSEYLHSDMSDWEYDLQVEEINTWVKLRLREIR